MVLFPPIILSKVASDWWPGEGCLHSLLVCVPKLKPWLQQYGCLGSEGCCCWWLALDAVCFLFLLLMVAYSLVSFWRRSFAAVAFSMAWTVAALAPW